MKKYVLLLASLLFVQLPTYADDLDSQPDQTYDATPPLMDETPPGGEQVPPADVTDSTDPVDQADPSDPADPADDSNAGGCPFSDDDDSTAPVDAQPAPEKYSEPDDQG